jgi:hypothetical protein
VLIGSVSTGLIQSGKIRGLAVVQPTRLLVAKWNALLEEASKDATKMGIRK